MRATSESVRPHTVRPTSAAQLPAYSRPPHVSPHAGGQGGNGTVIGPDRLLRFTGGQKRAGAGRTVHVATSTYRAQPQLATSPPDDATQPT